MIGAVETVLYALALAICLSGAFATSVLGRQAASTSARAAALGWMVLAAVAATCTIWADSFIAILASRADVPSGFRPVPMIASFVVGLVLMSLAARITMVGRATAAPVIGGTLAGIGVATTHFVGMQALRVAGTIEWNGVLVVASIAVAIVFSILAAATWLRSRSRSPFLAIALFAIAISGAHVLAVMATTIAYDPRAAVPAETIDDLGLMRILVIMALLIVALTLAAQSMNRKSRRRSAAEKRQLQQLAEVAVEGLVICDGSRIVWTNRSLEALVPGVRQHRIGTAIESLLTIPALAELPHDREFDTQLRTTGGTDAADERRADSLVPVRVITRAIEWGERPHVVVAIRDQRDRLRSEAEMQRLATSDALTGLANRGRFTTVLEQRFASPGLSGGFALLSLDLDRFKSVNDGHGHAAGDAVLIEVARRLTALVREGDLVARLGGDEFAILAATGGETDAIAALATRAIAAISQPFAFDGRDHQIGLSVGVAFAHRDGADPESLTRNADLALYRAKEEGRGTHRIFEPMMRARMVERHGLEQDLRQALAHDQLRLHFQPQVDARSGTFDGAEALVRWLHPVRGLVPPADFIGLAEETNLILPIGEWVLRTACAEAATWRDGMVVAVNLSPVQLRDPALPSIVASALADARLPGRRLELEITENVLIEDTARVKTVLASLKALGIRLSLDDFGTGYSSLGHLHRFPFDKIKVDRCFVQGVPDDPGGAAIIRAMIALAAGLGMRTIAEGVEEEAQRRFVVDAGCDQIQGYLYGRPVAADALPAAFRASDGRPKDGIAEATPRLQYAPFAA